MDSAGVAEMSQGYTGATKLMMDYAQLAIKAHKAAGIDQMTLSQKWMNDYGISPQSWNQLLRF